MRGAAYHGSAMDAVVRALAVLPMLAHTRSVVAAARKKGYGAILDFDAGAVVVPRSEYQWSASWWKVDVNGSGKTTPSETRTSAAP